MKRNYIFKDVDETFNNRAICFVTRNGIMSGYADGSFRPNETVTVAELCQIICRCIFEKYDDWEKEYETLYEDANAQLPNRCAEVEKAIEICYNKDFLPNKDAIDETVNREIGEAMLSKLEDYWIDFFQFEGNIQYHYKKSIDWRIFSRGEIAYSLYTMISGIAQFLDDKLYKLRINEQYDEAIDLINKLSSFFVDRFALNRDLSLIREYAEHSTSDDMPYLLRIANVLLRRLVRPDMLYHYTSLTALEHMTKDSAEVFFKASNSVYLNDPLEGKLLMHQLNKKRDRLLQPLKELQKQDRIRHGKMIVYSDTYILSFFEAKDGNIEQLPMWVHYGDGGNGCLIELDTQDRKLPFYRVMYQDKETRQIWREMKDALLPVNNDFEKTDKRYKMIYEYAYIILEQLSWLCKSQCYDNEQEVRLLFFEIPESAYEETFIRDGEEFPRIYMPCPEPLEISNVILGPKVMHPERYALSLNHRDIDHVFVSQLPFQ